MSSTPPPARCPPPRLLARRERRADLPGASDTFPFVSIVIPAYNVEAYVEAAIVSALDQRYPHFEVIVVDDGSTDGTRAVIERIAIAQQQEGRLRVIDRPNGGLSAARNSGIAAALGDLIGFLDSDDLWRADKLALQVSLMTDHPDIGLSFSYSDYMTESGESTGTSLRTSRRQPSLHDMLRRNHCGNGSTVLLRRECFELAGLFREELKSCEDYEMWCRILWATHFRAECVPEPLTVYRLRESSLSFNFASFTANADLAMACLRESMLNVPERRFRAGHAEHYRIAAWKAATLGQDATARALLGRALRLWPWLIVSDLQAIATALVLLVPARLRQALILRLKRMSGRAQRRAADYRRRH